MLPSKKALSIPNTGRKSEKSHPWAGCMPVTVIRTLWSVSSTVARTLPEEPFREYMYMPVALTTAHINGDELSSVIFFLKPSQVVCRRIPTHLVRRPVQRHREIL